MRWHDLEPLLKWGVGRINKNQNCIIMINGSTGSGKTYGGLNIAERFAKHFGVSFTIKDNLAFVFEDLLNKMELEKNQGKGVPFLFEEVGVTGGGGASREWQSKSNILFNSFIQTARHLNQILIFTCPNFHNLDKGTRELVHCQLITNGINFRTKRCILNPYFLQVNPTTAKIYRKRLRFKVKDIKYKLSQVQTQYPSEDLVKDYEKAKNKFTTKLRQSIHQLKKAGEIKKISKLGDKIKYITEDFEAGVSAKDMAQKYGVSKRAIFKRKKKWKNGLKGEAEIPIEAKSLRKVGFEGGEPPQPPILT